MFLRNIDKRININEAFNHFWIKGADILFNEKEKLYNAGSFLAELITDHISSFNIYMNKWINIKIDIIINYKSRRKLDRMRIFMMP